MSMLGHFVLSQPQVVQPVRGESQIGSSAANSKNLHTSVLALMTKVLATPPGGTRPLSADSSDATSPPSVSAAPWASVTARAHARPTRRIETSEVLILVGGHVPGGGSVSLDCQRRSHAHNPPQSNGKPNDSSLVFHATWSIRFTSSPHRSQMGRRCVSLTNESSISSVHGHVMLRSPGVA